MGPRSEPVRRRCDRASDEHDDQLRDLIRSLVECLIRNSPEVVNPAHELILDTEVDGVRYLVIRPTYQVPRIQSLLSPRELEIARMVAKGYPNKVIAGVLGISSWTVNTHVRRIFVKLGVSSRVAMVSKVIEERVNIGSPRDRPVTAVDR